MAKQKFYAVKKPSGSQIFTTWAECEKETKGVKGVLFKSFGSIDDAKAWLSGMEAPLPKGLRVYVDGSFLSECPYAGWAFIAVNGNEEVARDSGVTPFVAESRNIDGELTAALHAMEWLSTQKEQGVICHDYEGIARFAKGEWTAKSAVAKRYAEAAKPYAGKVFFEKIEAHSGHKWNELVDKLAKEAVAKVKEDV
ncbi:MAG: ribonuclease H family protein [Fibrobacteraceae bacterium]|nr:ribonuclease H family protein [Fibrobacteraceae bacterium]